MSDVIPVASTTASPVVAGSITVSTTVASGLSNSILVFRAGLATGSVSRTVTDVTLDPGGAHETAFTPLTPIIQGSGNFPTIEFWYLKNPPVGTFNVVANFDGTAVAEAEVTVAQNVDQTTPWNVAGTAPTSGTGAASVTVTTAVGELALDVLVGDAAGGGFSPGGSQTGDLSASSSGLSFAMSHRLATGTTTALTYTTSGSPTWYQAGRSLRPAGSAPPPATKLGIDSSPADDTSYTDRLLTFVVEIQDEAGDRVTTATDTVVMGDIVVADGWAALTKVIGSVAAVAGLATLTARVRSTQGADYTIPFTSGSLAGVSTPTMTGFVRGPDIPAVCS